jgi:hypothetical protein
MLIVTHLSPVCVERHLFVVQFYGLRVVGDGGGPVMLLESFIALILERYCVLLFSHNFLGVGGVVVGKGCPEAGIAG